MSASMCIWDFIHACANQAGLERLYANYQLPFLLEIREFLKFWIEENLINSNAYLDADNHEHYLYILKLLHNFTLKIDEEVARLNRDNPQAHALIHKLVQASNLMKSELAFPQRVQVLYGGIRRILNNENAYVQELKQQQQLAQTGVNAAARRVSSDHGATLPGTSVSQSQPRPNAQNQPLLNPVYAQISATCLELKKEADNTAQMLKGIHQKQKEVAENFCLQKTLDEIAKSPTKNGQTKAEEARRQLEDVRSKYNVKFNELNCFVHGFVDKSRHILTRASYVQNDIIQKELVSRRYETTTLASNLIDVLQGYCSQLAEVLFRCRLQLAELQALYPNMADLTTLQKQFSELCRKLERYSLIIETQTCQVIKKGTKFTAKLRFLAGSRSMSKYVSYGPVTASFLTKAEVRKLVRFDAESTTLECKANNGAAGESSPAKGRSTKTTSVAAKAKNVKSTQRQETLELTNESGRNTLIEIGGEIVNNVENLQTEDANASFSATFQTSKIENIFRRDREPGKSVLDLEYWILFHMIITETFNGMPSQRWVWAVSNPIKVHTHADQRAHAFETIIWLNAMDPEMLFSDAKHPTSLPWPNVAKALDSKCVEMTKVHLTPSQLEVLREKAFSVPRKNGYAPADHLTFDQFCKTEFNAEHRFTFWRWFYEIMKLTAKYLCGSEGKNGPWQDGCIAGFLSRAEAERILMLEGKIGSFLLRFSDGSLGGISIVGVQHNGVQHSTFAIAPATGEELAKRPLAERILDLAVLTHLYPNKPKADVFTPYLQKKDATAQSTALHRQYVKTFLQTVVNLPGAIEPKREQVLTPSPRSSIAQPTPPATPSYPFLMSNESRPESYTGYSPSSSHGFGNREDDSSDNDEIINQFRRLYQLPAANDDLRMDLENFLEQYVNTDSYIDLDSQDRSNSDDDQMVGAADGGEVESDYL